MLRSLPRTTCVLEVERKFRSLAVKELTSNDKTPPFRSIQPLDQQTIRDTYYDRSNLLSSAGIWVRQRNGQWEAKVKRGGSFNNSKFEELSDPHDISKCVSKIIGTGCMEQNHFGLERIAKLTTIRKTWIADSEFRIVLDVMNFGHTVGEVELQQQMQLAATTEKHLEQEKQKAMKEMDGRIAEFMERYSWAFSPGIPKGKLTAYFERHTR